MKKRKKIVKYVLFSMFCFFITNLFTYLFNFWELGFENLNQNLIVNNLATFFALLTVVSVKEVKFFYTEDPELIEGVVAIGFISGFLLTLPDVSYSLSSMKIFFAICSLLLIFFFSTIRLKFGIVCVVTIVTTGVVLRFFFGVLVTVEIYVYFSVVCLASALIGFAMRRSFLFSKKILKKVKEKNKNN